MCCGESWTENSFLTVTKSSSMRGELVGSLSGSRELISLFLTVSFVEQGPGRGVNPSMAVHKEMFVQVFFLCRNSQRIELVNEKINQSAHGEWQSFFIPPKMD